jgi:hypothetical protein
MDAGATFVLAEEHQDIDDHLWIVLSDPALDPNKVLLVSLTTHKPHKDQACLVQPSEHPWVRHPSCVAYDFARVVTLEALKQLRYSGKVQMREPLSPALLLRVRRCAADPHPARHGIRGRPHRSRLAQLLKLPERRRLSPARSARPARGPAGRDYEPLSRSRISSWSIFCTLLLAT